MAITKQSATDFLGFFGSIVKGKVGNCGFYWRYYTTWEELYAFTDVPADWRVLYVEYRSLLADLRTVSAPITEVCSAGGGTISDETDAQILAFAENARFRGEQLYSAVLAK